MSSQEGGMGKTSPALHSAEPHLQNTLSQLFLPKGEQFSTATKFEDSNLNNTDAINANCLPIERHWQFRHSCSCNSATQLVDLNPLERWLAQCSTNEPYHAIAGFELSNLLSDASPQSQRVEDHSCNSCKATCKTREGLDMMNFGDGNDAYTWGYVEQD
jgi:hypothetical protein